MSVPAERFSPEHSMEIQDRVALAVLERDVVHLDNGLSEVKTEIKEFRAETKAEFQLVRTEMKNGFQQVDAEIKEVRSEMNQKLDKVDHKIDNRFFWILGALGSVVLLIVGFIYFFFGAK